jgi:glycosyltransferase involved in cell wall biosynthesis
LLVAYPPIGAEYAHGDRARGRERFGLGPDDICLTVVGSISRGRGQDVAIRALARVRQRFPSARLLVVGSPHPRPVDIAFDEELRALAREIGVADAVVFAGTEVSGHGVEAMADVYAASDVVVNPARFAEPFGRVAPEALVAGRPVVASRVGAIPEVIRDGVDGLLVPSEHPDALAAAVIRVLDDPALARSMVESGRRRVLAEFGDDQDLAAWSKAFEAVRSDGGGPAAGKALRTPDGDGYRPREGDRQQPR